MTLTLNTRNTLSGGVTCDKLSDTTQSIKAKVSRALDAYIVADPFHLRLLYKENATEKKKKNDRRFSLHFVNMHFKSPRSAKSPH